MAIRVPEKPGELFDNADSFGMVFDEAWKRHQKSGRHEGLSTADKKQQAIAECSEHPFMLSNPDRASQIADFRIRLLGL
jgi:hypothetical protein